MRLFFIQKKSYHYFMRTHQASQHIENKFARRIHAQTIAGLDEVGRGAISGPLVVGCFVRDIAQFMPEVEDSKMLTPKKRRALVPQLFTCSRAWSLGIVEANDISSRGMSWALHEAFSRALRALPFSPDLVFYDGAPQSLPHPAAHAVIRGDATHATIAAASIIAKVFRDLCMHALSETHPQYGFDAHKGYGTEKHKHALLAHGLLPGIHRTQFVQTFLS